MISIRSLECLVAVTEQGSLTKAAVVLHISQPALSHQVAAIERELRTPVIERSARGTRPTAAGVAAAAEARIALAAAARAVTAGRRAAAGTSGHIRVACAESMTAWVLIPVLRSWRRRFPEVTLDLQEFTSANQMLDVLLAGKADVAVGPRPARTDKHVELLGREEIMVVAAARHGFADLDAVPLSELAAEPLVQYDADDSVAAWFKQFAAARRDIVTEATFSSGSARTAVQLATAGVGVTIAPFSVVAWLEDATIRPLDPPEFRDVVAVVAAPHDELIRRFVSDLKQFGIPDSRVSSLRLHPALAGT